jgi:hypothetical protein
LKNCTGHEENDDLFFFVASIKAYDQEPCNKLPCTLSLSLSLSLSHLIL